MASLVIRNIDEGVKEQIRVRGAQNGRSMEAEAREILTSAVKSSRPKTGLGSYLRSISSGVGGLEIPPRGNDRPLPDFTA